MLPEDMQHELAEDREWEKLKDAVDSFDRDVNGYGENDCPRCGIRVYGDNAEPHAPGCSLVAGVMTRDEPHFEFTDE